MKLTWSAEAVSSAANLTRMRDILRSDRLELVTTVLLGVATAVSAWCTYQAQLWNSAQLRALARANAFQAASLAVTEVDNRKTIADMTAFAAVLEAETRGDHRAALDVVEVARPEFKGPLSQWIHRRKPPSPFDAPGYHESIMKEPRQLRLQAQGALSASAVANSNADLFVMRTVMLALSLFFLGLAGQLKTAPARGLALGFGALILVLSTLSLALLHRAGRPRVPADEAKLPAVGERGSAGTAFPSSRGRSAQRAQAALGLVDGSPQVAGPGGIHALLDNPCNRGRHPGAHADAGRLLVHDDNGDDSRHRRRI
jgi:hypothetical protein